MKLNTKRTIFIGLAFLSISSFWQLYDNIIPLILQNNFGLGETLTGGIMAADNVLALFLLPLFGAFSDKVSTQIGKRTPFILIGTVVAVTFMVLIPISAQSNNFILFFISLGIVLIAMSTYRSPAVALMPDLTPKPLRSKANSIINLMGAAGAIFTLIMIKFLIPKTDLPSYMSVFIAVAVFMVIAVTVLFLTIKENKLLKEVSDDKHGYFKDTPEEIKRENEPMSADVKKSLFFC